MELETEMVKVFFHSVRCLGALFAQATCKMPDNGLFQAINVNVESAAAPPPPRHAETKRTNRRGQATGEQSSRQRSDAILQHWQQLWPPPPPPLPPPLSTFCRQKQRAMRKAMQKEANRQTDRQRGRTVQGGGKRIVGKSCARFLWSQQAVAMRLCSQQKRVNYFRFTFLHSSHAHSSYSPPPRSLPSYYRRR